MIRQRTPEKRTVSGLRTRYFPKARISHGFVSVAPWLDAVLLVVLFVLLEAKFVLQPGVVIDLPEAPFHGGFRSGMVAVVLSVVGTEDGSRDEIVFFDDERFLIRYREQMRNLRDSIAAGARQRPDEALIIQADRHVQHGTVMMLLNMAQQVGIKTVNVAARDVPGADSRRGAQPVPEDSRQAGAGHE